MQIKKIIRCQVVYILLVVLFVLAVIFNINTGNVHISPARIFRIIFLHGDAADRRGESVQYYLENPSAASVYGGNFRRGIVVIRIFIADLFQKSDCRTVCAWYFVRCKDVCCNHDDFSAEIYVWYAAVGAGCGRICRFASCHALCPAFCKPREKYVHAFGCRNYD